MSTLKVSNITDTSGGATTLVSAQNTAKAWGKYNGTANTLDDNYGITSVSDNGSGDFTFNFSTPFGNSNYAVVGSAGHGNNTDVTNTCVRPGTKTTSNCRVSVNYASSGTSALYDYNDISVIFFGD